jgi:hypothetical protein
MKFAVDRPYTHPEKAARKLIEIVNSVEASRTAASFIELINWPFLFEPQGLAGRIQGRPRAGYRVRLAVEA